MVSKKDDKNSVSEDKTKPARYQKLDRRLDKQERAKTGPAGELDQDKLDPPYRSNRPEGYQFPDS